MWQIVNTVMRYLERLDKQDWLLVLIGVVILGMFCMRGFGSRSSY